MARTKIVATIGPASNNPDTIRSMLAAGMTVSRINFSHGEHETHAATVKMLREIAKAEGKVLAILADLQGPKLRLGHVKAGGMQLGSGDEITLTPHPGQPAMIHLPHPDLIHAVGSNSRLVIGDGEVEFTVVEKKGDTLRCTVTVPGMLGSHKGVSAPGVDLRISSMTPTDKIDFDLIRDLDFDFIALSFVRSVADVLELRALMDANKCDIPIIAKIEKSEAIEHLVEIRDVVDGMMVARGDLGIDVPAEEVPLLQKRIIQTCNETGTPVITATQMLQSMVNHPRPTRAEASDVANAILDGTSAVMLSGETAVGKYPLEALKTLATIALHAEASLNDYGYLQKIKPSPANVVTQAIGQASVSMAKNLGAAAIISLTESGFTSRLVSKYRPDCPIMAITSSERVARKL